MAITIVDVEEILHQCEPPLTLCPPLHARNPARDPYCNTLLKLIPMQENHVF